jgi:hypothetical protein
MSSQRNQRRYGITERHKVLYFYSTQQRINTIDSQDEHFISSLMPNKYAIWKVQIEKIDN